jgi:hypothetical protein
MNVGATVYYFFRLPQKGNTKKEYKEVGGKRVENLNKG